MFNNAMRKAAYTAIEAAQEGKRQASIVVDDYTMVDGTGFDAAHRVASELRNKGYKRVRTRREDWATGDPDGTNITVVVDFS